MAVSSIRLAQFTSGQGNLGRAVWGCGLPAQTQIAEYIISSRSFYGFMTRMTGGSPPSPNRKKNGMTDGKTL